MNFNSKKIMNIVYVLIVIVLLTILVTQSKKLNNKTNKQESMAESNIKETEMVPETTSPTETQPETEAEEKVEKPNLYNAGEINNYIKGKVPYSGEKVVFLTFDDGPTVDSTLQILDILKANEVQATFFLQGRNINDSTAESLKRIHNEKSGIAVHSFSHNYKAMYPNRVGNKDVIVYEYQQTEIILKKYLGEDFKSTTWRYPGGHMSWKGLEAADQELKNLGVDWVDWNTMTGDAEPASRRPKTSAEAIQQIETSLNLSPTQDIAVVLMHDNKSKALTIETLPEIIKYFKDRGYKFGIFE